MTSRWGYGYGNNSEGYGSTNVPSLGAPTASPVRGPGSRRRKIAAMAGSVYRAGVAAAAELKEQYNNTRVRGVDIPDTHISSIPGSFPNVAIVTKGTEQMVLFPSYAKRHIKQFGQERPSYPSNTPSASQMSVNDEEYWRHEWAKMEDEKAVVDVDVRGWIYTPHTGPMTRRNRILVGLARRLSGIPPPTAQDQQTGSSMHEEHERIREEQKIAREARAIEKRGQGKKEVANRGDYSETPRADDSESDAEAVYPSRTRNGKASPLSVPSSPTLTARTSWAQPAELTEAELAVANANLMARLGPFLTMPLVQSPVTLFFYNGSKSQSRTVTTNEAGHFIMRAALDFVPTHVRVLANENLSITEQVEIIENTGVSLISDVDDTIKRSSISMGAREIFRNTFIRDLTDLTVEGVKEWYNSLHDMGVRIHYCSNSPWQLFPVLASFFHSAGLPPGSIHLKQYSGMLQGIFEPVAERKKGTLERILRDFPERKFLLVGDSGEADLEVYTELVVANPHRILAVFIRDVTTPELAGYFDGAFGSGSFRLSRSQTMKLQLNSSDDEGDDPTSRPVLPPRFLSAPSKPDSPSMGALIDLSEEPEEIGQRDSQNLGGLKDDTRPKTSSSSAADPLVRKQPPPRPPKPTALRSTPSDLGLGITTNADKGDSPPLPLPPPPPRTQKSSGPQSLAARHPLTQMQNCSDQTLGSNTSLPKVKETGNSTSLATPSNTSSTTNATNSKQAPPPPPPPRRRGTPCSLLNLSPRMLSQRHRTETSNSDIDFEPLPGPSYPSAPSPPETGGATTPTGNGSASVNRKVELWRRRLAKAHETLDQHGVRLYTWRRGDDVITEAEGIVREALGQLNPKKTESQL